MTARALAGSFRDPSGFIFTHDGGLYRQVNLAHREHYDRLLGSDLYDDLVGAGLLVAHTEVDPSLAPAPDAYRVLRPELVPFVSYPYEWCFSQYQAAALATLEIQERALDHGMSLRDASAYNVQFRDDGRPILIDTLSFEVLPENQPWVAYRQFCQHFLAPLALMSMVDVRLGQLTRVHLDGVPLDLASVLLPRRTRLRPGLLLHLHQHAKSQQRHSDDGHMQPRSHQGFTLKAFHGLVESLRATVGRLTWEPAGSDWVDYYEGDSYSRDAFQHKEALVAGYLREVGPATVWDLGANTGAFSRLAAAAGAFTVSLEVDAASVESSYRRVRQEGETGLLPLVMDVTNPSPGIGWSNAERASLADRGPADLVLALALVHHLAIADNLPLGHVAEYLHALAEWLVIEFVPKEDPKSQVLLATREDVFDHYTRQDFEQAFVAFYDVVHSDAVQGSQRTLYLMRARPQ